MPLFTTEVRTIDGAQLLMGETIYAKDNGTACKIVEYLARTAGYRFFFVTAEEYEHTVCDNCGHEGPDHVVDEEHQKLILPLEAYAPCTKCECINFY